MRFDMRVNNKRFQVKVFHGNSSILQEAVATAAMRGVMRSINPSLRRDLDHRVSVTVSRTGC
jgi:hypothetical protein